MMKEDCTLFNHSFPFQNDISCKTRYNQRLTISKHNNDESNAWYMKVIITIYHMIINCKILFWLILKIYILFKKTPPMWVMKVTAYEQSRESSILIFKYPKNRNKKQKRLFHWKMIWNWVKKLNENSFCGGATLLFKKILLRIEFCHCFSSFWNCMFG
jgi:hypothetical protein